MLGKVQIKGDSLSFRMLPCIKMRPCDSYMMMRPLRSNPTKIYKERLTALIEKGVRIGVLDKEEGEVLVSQFPVMVVFYHLPKTHKGLIPLVGRLGLGP